MQIITTVDGTHDRLREYRAEAWCYHARQHATVAWRPVSVTTNGSTQTRSAFMQNEYTTVSCASTPTYDVNGIKLSDETGKQ